MARVAFAIGEAVLHHPASQPGHSTHWRRNQLGQSLPFSLRSIKSHPIYLLFWGNTVVLLRWERLLITHIFIDLCAFLHKVMLKTGTKSVISFALPLQFLSPLNQTGAQTKAIQSPHTSHIQNGLAKVKHSLYYNKIFCCIFPYLLCSPVLGFCLFNFIIASVLICLYDFLFTDFFKKTLNLTAFHLQNQGVHK